MSALASAAASADTAVLSTCSFCVGTWMAGGSRERKHTRGQQRGTWVSSEWGAGCAAGGAGWTDELRRAAPLPPFDSLLVAKLVLVTFALMGAFLPTLRLIFCVHAHAHRQSEGEPRTALRIRRPSSAAVATTGGPWSALARVMCVTLKSA